MDDGLVLSRPTVSLTGVYRLSIRVDGFVRQARMSGDRECVLLFGRCEPHSTAAHHA